MGLSTVLALGCAGSPTPVAEEETPRLELAELGGEVWAFEVRVRGRAESCDRVRLRRGPVTVRADVREGRFSGTVPLVSGDNAVAVRCAAPARGEAVERLYRVRLPPTPFVRVRVAEIDEGVALEAGASRPNEGSDAPLVAWSWQDDPDNPAPLRTLEGAPLETADTARVAIAPPTEDGEYVAWVTVTDAAGRRGRAGTYFSVVDGEASSVDMARDHPAWVERAVVYGVVPFLFGEPAFDAVTERLPVLAELGVTALWLTPITQSPSDDFGYAVTDYFAPREAWGDLEDVRELVRTAHELGMRVLIDFVPNHSSVHHRYFEHALAHGARSRYATFYDRDAAGQPTHYFDWEHLPNLDYDEAEVRRWMIEAFSFWVRDVDVDGFRVDVAWGVVERAPEFFVQLREALQRHEPRVMLLAEASARRPRYFHGGFDVAYDWTWDVGQWAWDPAFDEGRVDVAALHRALTVEGEGFPPGAEVFRFLDNNDTGQRFVTQHGPEITRVASVLLFTVPGVPALFTGQEVGAQYHPYEREEPLEFEPSPERFEELQRLIALRRSEPALFLGAFEPVVVRPDESAYAYLRRIGDQPPLLIILHFGEAAAEVRVTLPPPCHGPGETLLGDATVAATGCELRARMPANDAVVLRLQ